MIMLTECAKTSDKIARLNIDVFITASFKEGKNKDEIEYLCSLVKESGFEDFCFIRDVENYQKKFDDPKELMNKAREEILKSDTLLIDMTHKPNRKSNRGRNCFCSRQEENINHEERNKNKRYDKRDF